MRWTAVLGTSLIAFGLGGCDDPEPLFIARCGGDLECDSGEICEFGLCKPKDELSCTSVQGGRAVLQPAPHEISFGHVAPGSSFHPLVLRNIGNCTLTVFEAYFEAENTRFGCSSCDPATFPIELFPFRDVEWSMSFFPDDVGEFADHLVLLSDDAEYPEIRVPVRGRFDGEPALRSAPVELDFGYAAVGRTLTQVVQLTNQGSGTAPLSVSKVEIVPSSTTAFSFEPEIMEPVKLAPVRVDNDSSHFVNVRYHPREIGSHHADLLVTTLEGPTLTIPLVGTSKTPPTIQVNPESIAFGPVPIGQTNARPLIIQNMGGSPLHVTYRWGGTGLSTDLFALPQIVPAIPPGEYTELQVLVTATSPTPITGLLILESNDPAHPTITVSVSADGQDVLGANVIKVEMVYDNNGNSFFDDDLRNVDMTLENPFGLICNKQERAPTNWGAFGTPTWIAFGANEEPERIVLPDAMQDGTYRVMLQYAEDCASVPTGLVAAILGISIDVLIAYLSGGAINIDSGDVSDVIDDLCLDHSGASVTVTVYVNGNVVAEQPAHLSRKGEYIYAVDLIRQNGQFSVR